MSLVDYREKRDFANTPEPTGGTQDNQLWFVVQKHNSSRMHFDFRLEHKGVLVSWAIPKGPTRKPGTKRLAMMTEDHPLDYRNFEGVIPEGNYGAGEVIIWDQGVYLLEGAQDKVESERLFDKGVHEGKLSFVLLGGRLKGSFALVRTRGAKGNEWLFLKHTDKYVGEEFPSENTSIVSGKRFDELKQGKTTRAAMLHDFKPMLATAIEKPFNQEGWVWEPKFDGYRATAKTGQVVELSSRKGLSFLRDYPSIVEALTLVEFEAILDGEIVVVDRQGVPSFSLLQEYKSTRIGTVQYYVFDVLSFDGLDLRSLPWTKRRETLEKIFPPAHSILKLVPIKKTAGIGYYQEMLANGFEGIVGKRADSRYASGLRSKSWGKVKRWRTQEAVVGGFTKGRGGRGYFGALVLGIYQDNKLNYIGHTGTGLSESQLKNLFNQLKPLIQDSSPFTAKVQTNEPPTWVKPELVVEVAYEEWTREGHLRQPRFLGIRPDRNPLEITREETLAPLEVIADQETETKTLTVPLSSTALTITHPHKVFFPELGCTKADILDYYQRYCAMLLPYLVDRPQSLHRFPHGLQGESFYQKNIESPPSFVKTHTVYSESNNEHINYLLCNNEETLLYMIQLGCIDINPWHSRVPNLDYPDYAIFDLDPVEIPFTAVVEVALALKEVGEKAGIPLLPKTSGGRGMHVYIPLRAQYQLEQVMLFLEILAKLVQRKVPKITSRERSPAKRKGKVYLDIGQNRHGQTIAAVYSIRPQPGATISTPLRWSEVDERLDPAAFTIETIDERILEVGDVWESMITTKTELATVLKQLKEL